MNNSHNKSGLLPFNYAYQSKDISIQIDSFTKLFRIDRYFLSLDLKHFRIGILYWKFHTLYGIPFFL